MSDDKELLLVTGGTGFIGRALVARLAPHYRVVSLDRSCPQEPTTGVACVEIDLTSEQGVRAALEEVRASHGRRVASVIHLAAYFDLEGKPHPDYERVTVRGTETLLRDLRASMALEQFVFASTLLVHAPQPPGQRIDENGRWTRSCLTGRPRSGQRA